MLFKINKLNYKFSQWLINLLTPLILDQFVEPKNRSFDQILKINRPIKGKINFVFN